MLNSGDRFGDYTVERLLGQGGMGAVYLLRSPDGGLVAAKILDPESSGDHESRKRFLREAELALGVKHPNLVETYDVGEDPDTGLCYILMEYVPGGSLADRLDEGPLPISDAIRIVYQIASVLELAREKGIVHRDIKPANIMFGADGKAKLADLGIARGGLVGTETTVTQTGMMIGTPAYMAPEQMLDAHHVDSRADIYSLGIVFYEMLAGQRPNPTDTVVQLMAKAVAGEPIPDVRKMRPEVSAAVAELVSLMCAMKADERVATPREVTTALSQIAHGREVTIRRKAPAAVRTASAPQAAGSRKPFPWKVLIPVGFLACLAVAFAVLSPKREQTNPPSVTKPVEPVVQTAVRTNVIERRTAEVRTVSSTRIPQEKPSTAAMKVPDVMSATNSVSWRPKIVDTGLPKKTLSFGTGVQPLEFVGCPAGMCEFGLANTQAWWNVSSRIPPHRAIITRPYWVQRVPLTFEQWAEFASPLELTEIEEALGGKRGSLGRVSMREVLTACEKLTARFRDQLPSGYVIRLPTEAEFGHACAAGSTDARDPYFNLQAPAKDLVSGYSRRWSNMRILVDGGMRVSQVWAVPHGICDERYPNRWGLCGMREYHWVLDCLPPLTVDERRRWHESGMKAAFKRLFDGPCRYSPEQKDPLLWFVDAQGQCSSLATLGRELHEIRFASGYTLVRLAIAPDLIKERGLHMPEPVASTVPGVHNGIAAEPNARDGSTPSPERHAISKTAPAKELLPPYEPQITVHGKPISFTMSNGVKMELVKCPAGRFTMGHAQATSPAWKPREVSITRPFWIGKYPVTVDQWECLNGSFRLKDTDRLFGKQKIAVGRITWHEACAFCAQMTKKYRRQLPRGYVFRLPAEAEWEYACRANANDPDDPYTSYWFSSQGQELAISVKMREKIAFFEKLGVEDAEKRKHDFLWPVGTKRPNGWGLYDMIGVNDELVLDTFSLFNPRNGAERRMAVRVMDYGFDFPVDDPLSVCEENAVSLMRGSFFNGRDQGCAIKKWCMLDARFGCIGFRVVAGPDLLKEWKSRNGKSRRVYRK